jgi:hypothetical protein
MTDAPTTLGYNPTTTAQRLAKFVKAYELDGVDIDYEGECGSFVMSRADSILQIS